MMGFVPMKKYSVITLMVLFFATTGLSTETNKATEEENKILTLILKRSYTDGGYTVVAPDTELWDPFSDDPKEIDQDKKQISEQLKTEDVDVSRLVDRLFKRNKNPVRLTLESSPCEGYLIDYDGRYERYFENGGGWEKWYEV